MTYPRQQHWLHTQMETEPPKTPSKPSDASSCFLGPFRRKSSSSMTTRGTEDTCWTVTRFDLPALFVSPSHCFHFVCLSEQGVCTDHEKDASVGLRKYIIRRSGRDSWLWQCAPLSKNKCVLLCAPHFKLMWHSVDNSEVRIIFAVLCRSRRPPSHYEIGDDPSWLPSKAAFAPL